jgi:pyruvate/2-oxoglutarate/acetoin dehydrogenase E1 component
MKTMTYSEAIRAGMSQKMREDETVFLFGEDVGPFGGCFGVSAGMHEEFGEMRVRDTPISEGVIVGAAVGAAATGVRPIAELMFTDFVTVGMDQLVNQAAKMRYMFGGHLKLPLVLRLPSGGGIGAAAQHSQSLEKWVASIPGLKAVYPSNAADAYGLMLSSIEDDNPVVFFEHKAIYGIPSEVPENVEPIPLGKARVAKEGTDVTIVTYGKQVLDAMEAAETLSAEGINAEVIDLRSLYPWDEEAVLSSVEKTSKVVLVSEETKRGAYIAEIASVIADKAFYHLDAPIKRVGALDTPVPFAPALEQAMLPNAVDIVNAVRELF